MAEKNCLCFSTLILAYEMRAEETPSDKDDFTPYQHFIHLAEEVGEVAKEIRNFGSLQKPKLHSSSEEEKIDYVVRISEQEHKFGREIADVIVCALILARKHGLGIKEIEDIIQENFNKQSKELGSPFYFYEGQAYKKDTANKTILTIT